MFRFLAFRCARVALVATMSSAIVVGGASTASAAVSAGCQPAIVDLGDPLQGGFSYADAVNANGTIVGSAYLPDSHARAVMWKAGHAVNLGVLGKYDESFAHGVSDDDTVVGELDYKKTQVAPFIYSHGRMRQLPGLGGDFGYASRINNHDVIVGTASDTAGNPHAVTWTDHGRTIHDLGIATGDVASFASGINKWNTAAGDSDDSANNERPAVFARGGLTLLSTSKTPYGSAEDINDSGQIIGISFLSNGDQHATYWASCSTRGEDLNLLPGGNFASLVDIDNAGHAVGGGNLAQNPDTTHAIMWLGHGSLRMLQPLSHKLYRDFAVARALDTHGNAVGASLDAHGDIQGTIWRCAAAQTVLPRPPQHADTVSATPATLPTQVAR